MPINQGSERHHWKNSTVKLWARYLDRFERRDGVWLIAHRQLLVDWMFKYPVEGWFDDHPDASAGRRDGDRSRTAPVCGFCGEAGGLLTCFCGEPGPLGRGGEVVGPRDAREKPASVLAILPLNIKNLPGGNASDSYLSRTVQIHQNAAHRGPMADGRATDDRRACTGGEQRSANARLRRARHERRGSNPGNSRHRAASLGIAARRSHRGHCDNRVKTRGDRHSELPGPG